MVVVLSQMSIQALQGFFSCFEIQLAHSVWHFYAHHALNKRRLSGWRVRRTRTDHIRIKTIAPNALHWFAPWTEPSAVRSLLLYLTCHPCASQLNHIFASFEKNDFKAAAFFVCFVFLFVVWYLSFCTARTFVHWVMICGAVKWHFHSSDMTPNVWNHIWRKDDVVNKK